MRESKNSFRLWRPPLFSRVGSRPSRDCNPARLACAAGCRCVGVSPAAPSGAGRGGARPPGTLIPRGSLSRTGGCVWIIQSPWDSASGLGPGLVDWLSRLPPPSQLTPPHPHPASQVARAPVVISVYRESGSKLGSISALAGCSAEPCRPGRRRENPAEPTFALSLPPPPGEVG